MSVFPKPESQGKQNPRHHTLRDGFL